MKNRMCSGIRCDGRPSSKRGFGSPYLLLVKRPSIGRGYHHPQNIRDSGHPVDIRLSRVWHITWFVFLLEPMLKALLGDLLYLAHLLFSAAIIPPSEVGQGKDEQAE